MTPIKRTTTEPVLVGDGNKTPSSPIFSKQELADIADYLRYARENIREYANETQQRKGGTFPMVHTLRAYAERAERLRLRIESAAR